MDAISIARVRRHAFALAALAVLAAWLGYLAWVVPSVSRGDFLLAILRVDADFRAGRLLQAITWPFYILGGHIVFYERALQLLNYYLLHYSPDFVKFSCLAAWGLLGLGLWRFVRRLPMGDGAQAAALLLLAVITFNPIAWETIAWPDATVPYLSALIALLFGLGPLVDILRQPAFTGHWRRLVVLCVLVIIGSGVGWAIIPTVMWVALTTGAPERRRARLKAAGAAALVLAAAAAVMIVFLPGILRLGLVTQSLAALPENLGRFVAYFLSLFSTLFGIHERPLGVIAGGAIFLASLLVYARYKRRFGEPSGEEVLYVFGLGGVLLVALGRWKLNMDRGLVVTYYHLFALPAFYGMLVMGLRLLPARRVSRAAIVAAVVLAASIGSQVAFYSRSLVSLADAFRHMIPAVSGWRMTEATRLIGSPGHDQDIFFDYLPRLKAQDRYRSLSRDFHPYRSTRIAPPVETANPRNCNADYRNLQAFETGVDDRAPYTQGYPQYPFHRFVGVARNPADCDQAGVSVSLVDAAGVVQCKSLTTPNVYWHYVSPEHDRILRTPFAFDFSCPMEQGTYYLVSQDPTGKVIESVKVAP
jgi:hypothetical protein